VPGGRSTGVIVGAVAGLAVVVAPPAAARLTTGLHPCGAAAAAGAVWIVNDDGGTLVRVDPAGNRVTAHVRLGTGICEVASGYGALWVASYRTGSLLRVDPRTHAVRRIRVGRDPFDVVAAAGRIWVTAWSDGIVVEVDPRSWRVVRRIRVGPHPAGLVFHRGRLWVGFGGEATEIVRVDPTSGSVERVPVGVKAPNHLAGVGGDLWVVADGGLLVRVDAEAGRVLSTVRLGRTLVQPALAPDGLLWVPDKESDTVFRVDPASGQLVDSFPGGDGAFTALSAFGSMWVTSYAGDDVWRF
jgi:streptogramin lyase